MSGYVSKSPEWYDVDNRKVGMNVSDRKNVPVDSRWDDTDNMSVGRQYMGSNREVPRKAPTPSHPSVVSREVKEEFLQLCVNNLPIQWLESKLGEDNTTLLVERMVYGRSFRTIAAMMDMSDTTMNKRIFGDRNSVYSKLKYHVSRSEYKELLKGGE